jgi:hypothetical protein
MEKLGRVLINPVLWPKATQQLRGHPNDAMGQHWTSWPSMVDARRQVT